MSNGPLVRFIAILALAATIKSVPLLMAAAGLSVCLRRSPAAARHMVWLAVIVGLFSLPILSIWHPRLPERIVRPLTVTAPLDASAALAAPV
ncbi:MAG TPA: hypothetical protein VFW40_07835, partial [Capsulimonadaceae bacterium]|nr:hypothetical protein [Capsulimonadaceae bacterium]